MPDRVFLQKGDAKKGAAIKEATAKGAAFFKKYWYPAVIFLVLAFSVFFRLEAYFLDRQFWHDEICLACNVIENDGFLWAFQPLKYFQMAPPLFLVLLKFFTNFFGISEMAFRFIPLLCGILSVFVFYFLSKHFLKTKTAIIFANFLFGINFALIRYSTELKQYSSDILIFMLVLVWLSKIKLESPTVLDILKYSATFTALFFLSQPTIFLLFGFVLYNILSMAKPFALKVFSPENNTLKFLLQGTKGNMKAGTTADVIPEIKGMLLKTSKMALIGIIPLIFVVLYKISVPLNLNDFMYDFWNDGFINSKNLPGIILQNIDFFVLQERFFLVLAPFCFIGFFIFAFKKQRINQIFLFAFFGVILASILHIYPFLHRLILFLFPFFIIFISSVFDFKISNKKISAAALILTILFTFSTLILFKQKIICKNRIENLALLCNGRDASFALAKNFDKEKDFLILPILNEEYYSYYDALLKFDIKKERIIFLKAQNEAILQEMEKLPHGKMAHDSRYWAYLPSDFKKGAIHPHIEKWLQISGAKVQYQKKFGEKSYLYGFLY